MCAVNVPCKRHYGASTYTRVATGINARAQAAQVFPASYADVLEVLLTRAMHHTLQASHLNAARAAVEACALLEIRKAQGCCCKRKRRCPTLCCWAASHRHIFFTHAAIARQR